MTTTAEDNRYMQLALDLAKGGFGCVEPNPMVGCVIVKDGQIIGKGFHEKFGQAHAEINALDDCGNHNFDSAGATMYVTLEPCCHEGKTGPCSDAIIKAGISKVIIAIKDPSVHVAGGGIEQLQDVGIEVTVGLCQQEALLLNPGFFKFAKTKRPWVIIKWAQSSDGKLAYKNTGHNRWISNELSRQDVHKLRRSVQGILVGIDTVIADDPLLTARPPGPVELMRIVLDSNLRVPMGCRILNTRESAVMIATTKNALESNPDKAKTITEKDVELLAVKNLKGRCDINELLVELGKRGIQQLLVEGGIKVITSFLESGLADSAVVYIAPNTLGDDGTADISEAMAEVANKTKLNNVSTENFGDNMRITGSLRKYDKII